MDSELIEIAKEGGDESDPGADIVALPDAADPCDPLPDQVVGAADVPVPVADAPAAPAAPSMEDVIRTWRGKGIDISLREGGQIIGRITTWGSSVSCSCKIAGHAKCSRPYTVKALPSDDVLVQWLLDGLGMPSSKEHMALPKPRA